MATLLVVEGPSAGLKFALDQHNLVMIGRDAKTTFQIVDGRISRQHLQIKRARDADAHSAIDFHSANGVYVNDQLISQETPLADGDLIQIGDSFIVYSRIDDPDAQTISQILRRHGQNRDRTELDTKRKPG
jgi:pSer/pThr/pTyr-binding forkhead associated (FHA) protein